MNIETGIVYSANANLLYFFAYGEQYSLQLKPLYGEAVTLYFYDKNEDGKYFCDLPSINISKLPPLIRRISKLDNTENTIYDNDKRHKWANEVWHILQKLYIRRFGL